MVKAIDYALLIGEIEGVHAKLKILGTTEELYFVEEMKKKYYKQYFAQLRKDRLEQES